jgi:hypothetical protein
VSARCKNIPPTAKHERLVCRMLCGMDAIEGAGLLIHGDQQLPPRPRFLGTCFAFGDGRTYLTAAHCVPADDEDAKSVYVMRPSRGGMRQVLAVRRHPPPIWRFSMSIPSPVQPEPFWMSFAPCEAGDDFIAFGFPEDTINGIAGVPTARCSKAMCSASSIWRAAERLRPR